MTSKEAQKTTRPPGGIRLIYNYELKNAPGKSIVALEVAYPPDGFTPPHTHAGATVVATVTEGVILSGMNGSPPRTYEVGEHFMELPGCHHTVSENASRDYASKLTAVFVVDTEVVKRGIGALTVFDEGWMP